MTSEESLTFFLPICILAVELSLLDHLFFQCTSKTSCVYDSLVPMDLEVSTSGISMVTDAVLSIFTPVYLVNFMTEHGVGGIPFFHPLRVPFTSTLASSSEEYMIKPARTLVIKGGGGSQAPYVLGGSEGQHQPLDRREEW